MSVSTIIIKLKSTSMLLAGIFLFLACDKIDEPYTKRAETGGNDTTVGVVKRVLLEDYTGHSCVNCPKAAITAHNLKQIHGDQLVLLAVHAGFFARPLGTGDFAYDFRTEAGTIWDNFFGVGQIGNPNGLINRVGYPNNHITAPAGWGAAVSNALLTPPLVDLQLVNEYNAVARKITTRVTTRFITTLDKNLKLIVVLTESGIIQPQKNNDADAGVVPIIYDYVHNHVLRAAITSPWGSTIATAGTVNPESILKSFDYILKQEYIPEKCTVVAFVYDDETKEILQAVESDVIQ